MYHKNYIGISKQKSGDTTVTKMEIIPQCCELKETCVTERSIVDINVKKHSHLRSRKTSKEVNNNSSKMVDTGTDPIYIRSSNSILKSKTRSPARHRRPINVNLRDNGVPASSSSSSTKFVRTYPTYTRNKGVQCEEQTSFISGKENNPFNTLKTLLLDLKRILKGNPFLLSLLDELEMEIHRLLFGQKNTLNTMDNKGPNEFLKVPMRIAHEFGLHSGGDKIGEAHTKLEETCRELESTCKKLKIERDTSIKLAADKSAELVETLVREADLRKKLEHANLLLENMSVKLENYTGYMENLNKQVKILKNENRETKRLKQQVLRLSNLLSAMVQENNILLTDLQQVTIERNRLQVALAIHEQQITKKNSELEKLYDSVPEQNAHQPVVNELSREENRRPRKSSSDIATSSSPSIGLAPSLCKADSDNSTRTPSPSSDRFLQLEALDQERQDDDEFLVPLFLQQQRNPIAEHQLNLDKLKEELKNIFTEVKDIANNIPSRAEINIGFDE